MRTRVRRFSWREPIAHLPRRFSTGPYKPPSDVRPATLLHTLRRITLSNERRNDLDKIGAKVLRHARYVTFQLAEVAVPRQLAGPSCRVPASGVRTYVGKWSGARVNNREGRERK